MARLTAAPVWQEVEHGGNIGRTWNVPFTCKTDTEEKVADSLTEEPINYYRP